MREIKYRAKCNATNQWVYGRPETSSTISNEITHIAQFMGLGRKFGRQNIFIKPNTVGQFTGFKDKKGKEIYEGDILSDWNEINGKKIQSKMQVFWNEKRGSWHLDKSFKQDKSSSEDLWLELHDFEYEVSGDIYS